MKKPRIASLSFRRNRAKGPPAHLGTWTIINIPVRICGMQSTRRAFCSGAHILAAEAHGQHYRWRAQAHCIFFPFVCLLSLISIAMRDWMSWCGRWSGDEIPNHSAAQDAGQNETHFLCRRAWNQGRRYLRMSLERRSTELASAGWPERRHDDISAMFTCPCGRVLVGTGFESSDL